MGQLLGKLLGNRRRRAPSRGPGWEDLPLELKQVILEMMGLRDFARAVLVCQEFRTAYRTCAAEGRATLVADAKKVYGEVLISHFVLALQRVLIGFIPCPYIGCGVEYNAPPTCKKYGLVWYTAGTDILITNSGPPRFATPDDTHHKRFRDEPLGVIHKAPPFLFATDEVFRAHLGTGQETVLSSTLWGVQGAGVSSCGHGKILLNVFCVSRKTSTWTLGVLLQLCRESPMALPASYESLLTIDLHIQTGPTGEAGVRVAEGLVAPLRPFVKYIIIYGRPNGPPIVTLKV